MTRTVGAGKVFAGAFARVRARGLTALTALLFVAGTGPATAGPLDTFEVQNYLVIATGEAEAGESFSAFQMSNVEIGADQEIISTSDNGPPTQRTGGGIGPGGFGGFQDGSSPSLNSIFVEGETGGVAGPNAAQGVQRWNNIDPAHDNDVVGRQDILPGSRPIYEGIDYSGNVAITGERAVFETSNSDVNATIGIQCNRASGCLPNPSGGNSFFASDGDPVDPSAAGYDPFNDVQQNLSAGAGVSQFDPTALTDELATLRDFIVGLPSDAVFEQGSLPFTNSNSLENQNIQENGVPLVTDLDAIDANGTADGIAVIDIMIGDNQFLVNNTDWILNTVSETLVIFRMLEGTDYNFSNSSIVMGDCALVNGECPDSELLANGASSADIIDELGAVFFIDAFQGTNEVFNLNNVVLGGAALWDLTDFNPQRDELLHAGASAFAPSTGDNRTVINLNSQDQGCSQFISNQVLMSNNRWNRCAAGATVVPEPATMGLFLFGLGGLAYMRRRRQATA